MPRRVKEGQGELLHGLLVRLVAPHVGEAGRPCPGVQGDVAVQQASELGLRALRSDEGSVLRQMRDMEERNDLLNTVV